SSMARLPMRGCSLPLILRIQPPFHFSWFSQSVGKPVPGLLSTLLNQAYSIPSRLVQTFLQVTEQVWQPMHLSRFSTMPTCERIFILRSPVPGHYLRHLTSQYFSFYAPLQTHRDSSRRCRSS